MALWAKRISGFRCFQRFLSFSSVMPKLPAKKPIFRLLARVNRKLVAFLAFVPGVFGLFGLGQLYQKDWHKGIMFLLTGILMMASMVMLLTMVGGPVAIILFIGLLILFIGGYLIQAFDAVVRSLFRF